MTDAGASGDPAGAPADDAGQSVATSAGGASNVNVGTPNGKPLPPARDASLDHRASQDARPLDSGRDASGDASAPKPRSTFVIEGSIGDLATDAEGNLWFTLPNSDAIGRITPQGEIARFSLPAYDAGSGFVAGRGPTSIMAGADGALWFSETLANEIGRVTPSLELTEFALPSTVVRPSTMTNWGGLAWGPDGNIWFSESTGKVARMTPSGAVTEFEVGGADTLGRGPGPMTAGRDGAMWFAQPNLDELDRITTDGVLSRLALPAFSRPTASACDSAGNLFILEEDGNAVARLSPEGALREYPLSTPYSSPRDIAIAPDGVVWFTAPGANALDSLDAQSGSVTEHPAPLQPYELAVDRDGAIWFDTLSDGPFDGVERMQIHRYVTTTSAH